MNKPNVVFVISAIVILLMSTCGGKRTVDRGEVSGAADSSAVEREQIKSFWDYYRQAQKYRINKQWDLAAEYYVKALEINPEHEDALFNLGNMYLELQRYADSEHCWRKVIEIYPNSARAHLQLGRLYLSYERPEVFDIDKAQEAFLITSGINKVVTGPLMLLGHVDLLRGDLEEAGRYFSSVIGSDTKSVEGHFLLGYIAWKEHKASLALDLFSKAVAYSAPEKAIEGVLSEGDTREGISHLRPINESLFNDFFINLDSEKGYELSNVMVDRYAELDEKLKEIRRLVV